MDSSTVSKVPAEVRTWPFQVRGSVQTMLSLRLVAPDDPSFFTLLVDKIAHSPDFYRNAPLILDVAPIADSPPIDLDLFCERLKQHKLQALGLQNGSSAWNEAATKAGLVLFAPGGQAGNRGPERRTPTKTDPAPPPARGPGMVVTEPVRGGQQIQSADGDLVVLGFVGHGAELAASGHIHIYGSLRGRAFAGIHGDESAMIFCDALHAELLSIAGIYLVNEDIDPTLFGRRVRVRSNGERLLLEALT